MIQGFSSGLLGNRELIYETDLPSFQRDFASLKTLDHGYGPAITFTRGSNATYFDANGVRQTASTNEPRFDHSGGTSLGLLIEEARTNSLRNSQAGGAVVGTSTLPTNWVVGTSAGLTRSIVATGTENGMSYVDLRLYGTPTGTATTPYFESVGAVSASSGQAWTSSFYCKLVSGDFTNVESVSHNLTCRDASNVAVDNDRGAITIDASMTRFSRTVASLPANTASIMNGLWITLTVGNAVDFTLRIAAPQLEQGAFPTSYIPTTNAAATRAADLVSLTSIGSFYNQTEGSVFGESTAFSANNSRIISFSDNTTSNRIFVSRGSGSGGNINASVSTGGVLQFSGTIFASSLAANTTNRFCFAYRSNDFAGSANGLTPVTNTSASVPVVSQLTIGSGESVGSNAYSGYIRKIAYWPKRLSNTLLQQLTT